MANDEQLRVLKEGSNTWNEWRKDNPNLRPDLTNAVLVHADLGNANLSKANFRDANLTEAILCDADLTDASLIRSRITEGDLSRADLAGADLSSADLAKATLRSAELTAAKLFDAHLFHADLQFAVLLEARLCGAILTDANFENANLEGADLRNALIVNTNFTSASLSDVNFSGALMKGANLRAADVGETIFGRNDLREVEGLESLVHLGPSLLSVETLARSQGEIPEAFVRGCGFPDWEIESTKLHRTSLTNEAINTILYNVQGLRATQAIQINPLFISYSHEDKFFVDEMETRLLGKGIRFWRDIHHLTSGRLEKQIDRAIRLNPTVLLVLSERSVNSDWVEHEVRLARKLEKESRRDVLCPIALDDNWKTCHWPERLREQILEYQILDFSGWADSAFFDRMFTRLIKGLDLFYK